MSPDGDAPVGSPRRLRELLSWQANKVATLGSRLTLERMAASARGDFAVLAALAEIGDLSQAEVGRRLGLDRNDVNEIATRLEHGGYVSRRPDERDRRLKVLSTTRDGQAYLARLQTQADEVQEELMTALTAAERAELIKLLGMVLNAYGPQSA